ncbi:MAG TPA: MEDS domain-containing protein [Candidatus Dormibacteraeota bacterium]|nr:MEDS domain-containing protein [Candidatus Dormibacteraeota bacterium]
MRDVTDRLLTTAEAARFLRVSQASIRRWSDSGLLPARRVGRRGERRFRESELIVFLNRESTLVPAPAPSGTIVNVGGVELAVPSHIATFYSSDAGRLRLTRPFLVEGLRAGQRCFVAAKGPVLDEYVTALQRQDDTDFERALRDGKFQSIDFQDGTAGGAIAQWEDNFARLLAEGPGLIRIVGEMLIERTMFRSQDEMLAYEELFEVMYKRYPVVVICQYDVRGFDGLTLLRALKAHPSLFGYRIGTFLN